MIDRLKKALDSALINRNPDMVEELVKKGVKLDPQGIKLDPQRILNVLFETDRDCQIKPNHLGMFGRCEDWAHPRPEDKNKTEKNAEKWIRAFIASQTDINTQYGKTGNTALMWTSFQGFDNCTKLLLEANADPLKMNHKNETAFDIAARRQKVGCVKLILDVIPDAEKTLEHTVKL